LALQFTVGAVEFFHFITKFSVLFFTLGGDFGGLGLSERRESESDAGASDEETIFHKKERIFKTQSDTKRYA
jgi:hypothetical protein